ncbi:MAG: metallopeptidase family protein [Acidobacteria bacterium]|nr:metallopeptidase family protein [Acidobacteriota bacterium]
MNQKLRNSYDDLLRRAQDALDREDFDEAEALGRRAQMLQADSLDARQVIASALIEQARYEDALPLLEEILAKEPEDLAALADAGLCLFEMCEFEEAEALLARALEIDPADPQANYWTALCIERQGHLDAAEDHFQQAHEMDPEAYPLPIRISREEFDRVVRDAIAELPPEIRGQLQNISIMVQDLPSDEDLGDFEPPLDPCLFGLYIGVPLPERSTSDPPQLPDTIYVYKRNLERMGTDRDVLVQEIRTTILHEIGHYLGFDEEDLAERGYA